MPGVNYAVFGCSSSRTTPGVSLYRSSRPEVFCEIGALKNFAKFTGKHLCQSHFFNKVAGRRPVALWKKGPWQRCFLVNFAKYLRTPFL